MTSPFLVGKKAVVQQWKELRAGLDSTQDDIQQLEMVMKFWNKAPISSRMLDWDDPSGWPGPWEMIDRDEYDDSMLSLAMFYTLHLGQDQRWNGTNRLRLLLIRDRQLCIQRLILEVDETWLINLEYDRMVNKETTAAGMCMVQQRYHYDGKVHSILDAISSKVMEKTNDNRGMISLNIEPSTQSHIP